MRAAEMTLLERLTSPGPKRILALEGGGIRGALMLGFLESIEKLLRARHGRPDLRLCDYFDLIGGTSVGSIMAAGLAIGMEAGEIKRNFLELGGKVFRKKRLKRWQSFFDARPLEEELAGFFGDRTLGDSSILTGLCIIVKRADTRSIWPLLNHPRGKYYDLNRHIPLRQAIRASTAAPMYFVPEKIDVGSSQMGAFVDGGVSMANNPALQLFLVATLQGFPFRWLTGEDRLLVVSLGTGAWRHRYHPEEVGDGLWDWATGVPSMLMEDASWQNQLLLQYLSRSRTPWVIDSEVGDLGEDLLTPTPALTYLRYNVWLEEETMADLNLAELAPRVKSFRQLSAGENRHDLARVGVSAAAQQVQDSHFPPEFDLEHVAG